MTTIMVVEDEEFLQGLYREVLEKAGHTVVGVASNGEEAVEAYRALTERPRLVLMDHRMPVKNGIEAMEEILALDPGASIVFLTADHTVAKAVMMGGAAGYISKPFGMNALLRAIDRLLVGDAGDEAQQGAGAAV
jgi:two-component system chemotaxis response regulator CheY